MFPLETPDAGPNKAIVSAQLTNKNVEASKIISFFTDLNFLIVYLSGINNIFNKLKIQID